MSLTRSQLSLLLDAIDGLSLQIHQMRRKNMTDQDKLDVDVAGITDSLGKVEANTAALLAEIDLLKAQPGATALDFTGLDAVTAQIAADVPPPADPTPPAPPVDPNM